MKTDVLTKAKRLLNARRFPEVIALLEPLLIDYRDSFSFYYTLGTACLYVGDIGGAELYYKKARNLKLTDTALINAQLLNITLKCKNTIRANRRQKKRSIL